MSGYLVAAVLICGIPYVYPVTKGQRVRSSPDIPLTQFTCVGRPPGYYADLETGCQVYHMCTEGGNQFSYKCPNTTLFQQRMLICAHWYQVNCSRSEQHYGANLLIGQRDKPFVNDDPALFKDKKLKTLHNPDVLQNLGQSTSEGSSRQGKAQPSNENFHANRVFQNNLKRDGGSSIGFPGKTTPFTSSFSTTSSPVDSRRTTVDLSSLPLAGSVLPGGLKSFQFAHAQEQGLPFNSQSKQQTFPFRSSSPPSIQFRGSAVSPNQKATQTDLFASPTPTPNSIDRVNFFSTTKSPSSFISKFFTDNQNKFQANGFTKIPQPDIKQETSTSEPSFEFLPPSEQNQSNDLTVASQENAFSNRRSTTTPPPTFEIGENLPETDVKAVIEQPKNGSLPDDRFNTFIKRFNPFEKPPSPTTTSKPEEGEPEYHTFINRFVPDGEPSPPENNLREQPEHHIFVNRFVLTPEEQKREKDRVQVDKLHDLLPPEDQLTVSFPNFDLMPPHDDSDESESNKIELHLQDPRRTFFIPSEEGNEFSKADAAPIVVTIPLHSHQKSPPMWFRSNESEDPCGKCHPSFIVNKETCVPCVIIR